MEEGHLWIQAGAKFLAAIGWPAGYIVRNIDC